MQPCFDVIVDPNINWLTQISTVNRDLNNLNHYPPNVVDYQTHLIHIICIKYDDGWLDGRIVCILIILP